MALSPRPAAATMFARSRVASAFACLVLLGACSVPGPADSVPSPAGAGSVASPTPLETAEAEASATAPLESFPPVEPGDPTAELTGRAVEALGGGEIDAVMRIGAEGFRLPEGERLYDVHGDRVLSVRADPESGSARLIVRDLAGDVLWEIDAGMQVPQTASIRGDDVYFGGIDFGVLGDPDSALDRGSWVAYGDARPEPIVAARNELAIYSAFERSPDGRTVGIWRCGEDACTTTLVRRGSDPVEIPQPGLIALTNEVALLIGRFSDVTAFAASDGAELWRAETTGVYYGRYATTDGTRIVISSIEDAGDNDGNTSDQLRIEVLDALTGAAEQTVLVPVESSVWVEPSLSSDRYVAILERVLPIADEGPHIVRFVDLEAGRLLDLELLLGEVP